MWTRIYLAKLRQYSLLADKRFVLCLSYLLMIKFQRSVTVTNNNKQNFP